MRGPRIDHYNRMEELAKEQRSAGEQWSEMESCYIMAIRDAAAAGYEQALRDFANWLTDRYKRHSGARVSYDWFKEFAAERGIDLSDGAS